MGQYLVTGIINKIAVEKKRVAKESNLQYLIEKLEKQVNFNKYELLSDENRYVWQLKSENIASENLLPFISAQQTMYNPDNSEAIMSKIEQVLNGKTRTEILEIARERSNSKFQATMVSDYFRIPEFFGCVEIQYELLVLFVDGKIVMECYNDILLYFGKLIKLQCATYPIADCVKVAITN